MRFRSPWLIPLSALLLASGCEEPRNVGGTKAAAPEPPKDNFIVGKTTQDVRLAEPELQKGAQAVTPRITAKDPITMSGNAYVYAVDSISAGNVKHAIDLYEASSGHYPKDFAEFRDEVLKPGKPDGIALPKLPYYQEYGYDEKEHKLIILEYPDRKNGPLPK